MTFRLRQYQINNYVSLVSFGELSTSLASCSYGKNLPLMVHSYTLLRLPSNLPHGVGKVLEEGFCLLGIYTLHRQSLFDNIRSNTSNRPLFFPSI